MTDRAENNHYVDHRLVLELLRRIRGLDGGACLTDLLYPPADRDLTAALIAAMTELAAEVRT